MEAAQPGEITSVPRQWSAGDAGAVDKLAPLVYDHLRGVAAGYLNRERGGVTLQATGLVHEVFVRLLRQQRAELTGRVHFYAFAARMMRRILVDAARARQSGKRAVTGWLPLSPDLAWIDPRDPGMLDLDTALDELAAEQHDKARVVELRVFLGCTAAETAELMGISKATADREMRFDLAWLYDRLRALRVVLRAHGLGVLVTARSRFRPLGLQVLHSAPRGSSWRRRAREMISVSS